jgi:hypothetical protein
LRRYTTHDQTFMPAHVRSQFTINTIDDLTQRNAREARLSLGRTSHLTRSRSQLNLVVCSE